MVRLSCYRKKGALLTGSVALAMIIIIVLLGIGYGGFYAIGAWRNHSAELQARAIDNQLENYADAHRATRGADIDPIITNNVDLNYKSRREYPAAITEDGMLVEHDKNVMANKAQLTREKVSYNYVSQDVSFTDEPEHNTYKFHYVPIFIDSSGDGREWTESIKAPIRAYNLYYYSDDGQIHYSPNSYYYQQGTKRME